MLSVDKQSNDGSLARHCGLCQPQQTRPIQLHDLLPLGRSILLGDLDLFEDCETVDTNSLASGIYDIVARDPDGKWRLYIGSTSSGFGSETAERRNEFAELKDLPRHWTVKMWYLYAQISRQVFYQ
jgi:hypothetical protein